MSAEKILDRNHHDVDGSTENLHTPEEIDLNIRAARQDDAMLIWEMHERMSKDSIYFRYLSGNKPSLQEIQSLCSSGNEASTVLVAEVDEPCEKIIAIACFRVDSQDASIAEPAILVEDSCQGCGVGKRVMGVLFREAIRKGLKAFRTFVHPSNYRAMKMIESSGYKTENRYNDGLKEIRVSLDAYA